MTYEKTEEKVIKYYGLMNTPILSRKEDPSKKHPINLMLISPSQAVEQTFNAWLLNGKDNKLAVEQLDESIIKDFYIFVCNYKEDKLLAWSSLKLQLNRMGLELDVEYTGSPSGA